ncbi:MAG: DNA-binding protein WhiA [Oscillospiraceae bacterium]|nr:DNA-binding protein WhiA [Candidatus Equicaccousia limihippi]
MSFSRELKKELCKIGCPTCCKMAECYGLLLFSGAFETDNLCARFENDDIAEHLASLCNRLFRCSYTLGGGGIKKEIYTFNLNTAQAKTVKEVFLSGDEKSAIQHHNIEDECCRRSFLRGVFLACGYVSDPQKKYGLEFVVQQKGLADELFEYLCELGFSPKMTVRQKSTVIYFKDSETIEDILTTLGATEKTFDFINAKIYKNLRERENRLNNCETANIEKTVTASVIQRMAITKLRASGIMDELSPELQTAAKLREENPESSLNEMVQTANGLSRSGLNHRLNRLVQIAKERNLI